MDAAREADRLPGRFLARNCHLCRNPPRLNPFGMLKTTVAEPLPKALGATSRKKPFRTISPTTPLPSQVPDGDNFRVADDSGVNQSSVCEGSLGDSEQRRFISGLWLRDAWAGTAQPRHHREVAF